MGLYDRYVLPRVINLACSSSPNMKQREKVIPRAEGDVLEIGSRLKACANSLDAILEAPSSTSR
jgi:hypothetical protein